MERETRTAGIIIIGNEILSGKVKDVNSHYLATELRSLGVELKKISVIPDDPDAIGREARVFSDSYNYVFTTGGVGPTHDDVTMEGIARGFGVGLVISPEIRGFLTRRYRGDINEAVLKMARVPDGSQVICLKDDSFPFVRFRNIFIFPGIPQHLRERFQVIKEQIRTRPFYLQKVFLRIRESDITGALNRVVSNNKGVVFGSYPVAGDSEYLVMITAESRSEALLRQAVDELIDSIPEDAIVRIE
jgi:molybdenum cofactor synthesis domain-containing protein